jgi:Co/Zn/Cd efflux system component
MLFKPLLFQIQLAPLHVGVIISTALVQWRGWVWADPAAAVGLCTLNQVDP